MRDLADELLRVLVADRAADVGPLLHVSGFGRRRFRLAELPELIRPEADAVLDLLLQQLQERDRFGVDLPAFQPLEERRERTAADVLDRDHQSHVWDRERLHLVLRHRLAVHEQHVFAAPHQRVEHARRDLRLHHDLLVHGQDRRDAPDRTPGRRRAEDAERASVRVGVVVLVQEHSVVGLAVPVDAQVPSAVRLLEPHLPNLRVLVGIAGRDGQHVLVHPVAELHALLRDGIEVGRVQHGRFVHVAPDAHPLRVLRVGRGRVDDEAPRVDAHREDAVAPNPVVVLYRRRRPVHVDFRRLVVVVGNQAALGQRLLLERVPLPLLARSDRRDVVRLDARVRDAPSVHRLVETAAADLRVDRVITLPLGVGRRLAPLRDVVLRLRDRLDEELRALVERRRRQRVRQLVDPRRLDLREHQLIDELRVVVPLAVEPP